jgi:hypothetical protein
MPAGDLVTQDWQMELRATLFGATTTFGFDRQRGGISGLGRPPVKSADVEIDGDDGSYGSPDFDGPRTITVALRIKRATASAAMNDLTTINTAWAPSTTDIPLYLRLPGWGTFHVNGRPRGVDDDGLVAVAFGLIHVMCTFVALDPALVFP